uniref:D-aminoacyl-tRNA deacylase 1 n=1 Tax=Canis lupus familiaris TaxID=9615 RepID=A0A8C0TT40_CANLF
MRDRERQRHRQREKQAPCRQPRAGPDSMAPESRPELKADAQLRNHLVHLNGYFRQQILFCLVSEKPLRQEDKGKGIWEAREQRGRRVGGGRQDSDSGQSWDFGMIGSYFGDARNIRSRTRGWGAIWVGVSVPAGSWAGRRRGQGRAGGGAYRRGRGQPWVGVAGVGAPRRAGSVGAVAALPGVTRRGRRPPRRAQSREAGRARRRPTRRSRRHESRGAARHPGQRHRVRKILNLRVFEDESGKHWSKSVMDKQYEVLCISQFTLQCVLKGNKPDFHLAMPTEQAESFYNSFLEQLRKTYRPELIKDGKFGTYMQVHIQNDGPVTIELESPAPGAATSDPKQMRLSASQRSHQMALTVLHLPLTICQSLKNSSRGKKRPEPRGLLNQAKKETPPEKKTAVPAVGQRVTCLLNGSRRLRDETQCIIIGRNWILKNS